MRDMVSILSVFIPVNFVPEELVSKVVTKGIEQMICTQTTLPSDSGNVN
jgi:hypothetical protein